MFNSTVLHHEGMSEKSIPIQLPDFWSKPPRTWSEDEVLTFIVHYESIVTGQGLRDFHGENFIGLNGERFAALSIDKMTIKEPKYGCHLYHSIGKLVKLNHTHRNNAHAIYDKFCQFAIDNTACLKQDMEDEAKNRVGTGTVDDIGWSAATKDLFARNDSSVGMMDMDEFDDDELDEEAGEGEEACNLSSLVAGLPSAELLTQQVTANLRGVTEMPLDYSMTRPSAAGAATAARRTTAPLKSLTKPESQAVRQCLKFAMTQLIRPVLPYHQLHQQQQQQRQRHHPWLNRPLGGRPGPTAAKSTNESSLSRPASTCSAPAVSSATVIGASSCHAIGSGAAPRPVGILPPPHVHSQPPVVRTSVIRTPEHRMRPAKRDSRRCRIRVAEYLLSLLWSDKYKAIIEWYDEPNNVFRILDTKRVAHYWGVQKGKAENPSDNDKIMDWDKMGRAIRFGTPKLKHSSAGRETLSDEVFRQTYKGCEFERLSGGKYPKKLVYKFRTQTVEKYRRKFQTSSSVIMPPAAPAVISTTTAPTPAPVVTSSQISDILRLPRTSPYMRPTTMLPSASSHAMISVLPGNVTMPYSRCALQIPKPMFSPTVTSVALFALPNSPPATVTPFPAMTASPMRSQPPAMDLLNVPTKSPIVDDSQSSPASGKDFGVQFSQPITADDVSDDDDDSSMSSVEDTQLEIDI